MTGSTGYPCMSGKSKHLPGGQWHSLLWLWWTLANALGGALVGALEEGGFQFFATLVLTGPVIGVAQWLVMRRYIRATGWWVVVSSVGWWCGINLRILLGGILNRLVQSLWQEFGLWEVFWINTVQEPVTLVSLGFFQWLLLCPMVQVGLATP